MKVTRRGFVRRVAGAVAGLLGLVVVPKAAAVEAASEAADAATLVGAADGSVVAFSTFRNFTGQYEEVDATEMKYRIMEIVAARREFFQRELVDSFERSAWGEPWNKE
jgi:hypothetical protein